MSFLHKDLDSTDDEIKEETTEFKPSHFVVRIDSFSLLSENGIDRYECTEFDAGGYKWRLVIYPNGKERTFNDDNVSVYLSVAEPNLLEMSWEVSATFGIFLHNQIANNFLRMRGTIRSLFHVLSPSWGFAKLISKKRLIHPHNGFLVSDTCIFGAEVFVFQGPGTVERLSLTKAATPYVRSWTISDFSKIKDVWKSENFTAAGQSWYACLFTGGSGESTECSVSIFLFLDNGKNQTPCRKVKAKYTFRIKDQTGNRHQAFSFGAWFGNPNWSWGRRQFMLTADMNDPTEGYLVKDCCILEIEITVLAVARCSP